MGASTTLFNCRRRQDAYYVPGPMATNNSWDFVSNIKLVVGIWHALPLPWSCDCPRFVILSPRGGATPLLYVTLHT
jgi:hypothetical protein